MGLLRGEAVAGLGMLIFLAGESTDEVKVGSEVSAPVVEWEADWVDVLGRELTLW
jgi:hypothetical protein